MPARRIIDALMSRYLNGQPNGAIRISYDEFEACGIRRGSIRPAIEELQNLSLVETRRVGRSLAFRMSWLP